MIKKLKFNGKNWVKRQELTTSDVGVSYYILVYIFKELTTSDVVKSYSFIKISHEKRLFLKLCSGGG